MEGITDDHVGVITDVCQVRPPHAAISSTLELDSISKTKIVSLKVSTPSNSCCHCATYGIGSVDTISSHLKEGLNFTLTQPPAISDHSKMVDLASFKPMFVLKSKQERCKNDRDKD